MKQCKPLDILKKRLLNRYKKLIIAMRTIHQKRKTRRELAKLPDHLFKDINLNRYNAEQEIKKSLFIRKE